MLKNYIKLAIRNLWKEKSSAFINILGLSVGIASVLMIFLFVRYEMGIDGFHEKGDQIFRLTYDETVKIADGRHLATTSPPMGPALVEDYPEVEKAVRFRYADEVVMEYAGQQYYEDHLVYADNGFFDLFSFPLKAGSVEEALASPNSVVITPEIAQKYFGEEDPMGKTIHLDEQTPLEVTGIFKEKPSRSHLDIDFLVSFSTFKVPFGYPVTLDSWGWVSFHTYLLLKNGTDVALFEPKLEDFIRNRLSSQRADRATLKLQPLQDIYFHSASMLNVGDHKTGNIAYNYGLSITAFLLLLIAGFNFMNITTARSINRAKEVGVRKVLGAVKKNLVQQFLGEAVVVALISLVIGVILFEGFKDIVIGNLGWELGISKTDYLWTLPVFIGIAVITGILAGLYPSFVLSRFKAVEVFKGKIKSGKSGSTVRKALVVAQFVITGVLISCSLIVNKQMDFIRNQDTGFDKEQVISLQLNSPDIIHKYRLARQVFEDNPNVMEVSAGDIINGDYGSVPIIPEGVNREDASAMHIFGIYFDYCKAMGIELVEGREISFTQPTDTLEGVLINEAAVKHFGWENPIGKRLQVNTIKPGVVIGVVKDFHFKSLHDPIEPLVMYVPVARMGYLVLRVNTEDVAATIASLEEDWQKIAPELPFDFAFVDEQINAKYESDQRFSALINFFGLLTVIVACLGLYGLIAIMLKYRVKEIGIRKVLGASISSLAYLLSGQFLALLLLANLIAIPLAWWSMQQWLNNFAYQVEVGSSVFILASLMILFLALATIGYQTLKAALGNPVEALKDL